MSEADALVVAIADLREALQRVLDAAEKKFGSVVDLAADYYWTVPSSETFDNLEMPTALEAGQLSDDVGELRELLAREDGEIFIWHDLNHLVGILQRVASLDSPPS
jgi:hypothetical protein